MNLCTRFHGIYLLATNANLPEAETKVSGINKTIRIHPLGPCTCTKFYGNPFNSSIDIFYSEPKVVDWLWTNSDQSLELLRQWWLYSQCKNVGWNYLNLKRLQGNGAQISFFFFVPSEHKMEYKVEMCNDYNIMLHNVNTHLFLMFPGWGMYDQTQWDRYAVFPLQQNIHANLRND